MQLQLEVPVLLVSKSFLIKNLFYVNFQFVFYFFVFFSIKVGTSPNLLLKGHFDKYYPNAHLDFLSFLLYGLPCSILMLIATWIWIIIRWLPRK